MKTGSNGDVVRVDAEIVVRGPASGAPIAVPADSC